MGDPKSVTFMWTGSCANELEAGEVALLATEQKLGKLQKLTPGREPQAFTKAWNGELKILSPGKSSKKLFIYYHSAPESAYLEEIVNCQASLRQGEIFVLIDYLEEKYAIFSGSENHRVEIIDDLTAKLKRLGYSGELSNNNERSDWFDQNIPGKIALIPTPKLTNIWKIEQSKTGQMISLPLDSRRKNEFRQFDQVQLNEVCILLTDNTVYVWHDKIVGKEGSSKEFSEKLIQNAKMMAEKMTKGEFQR